MFEAGRSWLLIVDNVNPDKLIATNDTNPDGPIKPNKKEPPLRRSLKTVSHRKVLPLKIP
jgi:hypothetical protein